MKKSSAYWFACFPLLFAILLPGCGQREAEDDYFPEIPGHILEELAAMNDPTPSIWTDLAFPTDQQGLLDPDREDVFQPTAAGTRESALYGSVRTVQRGGRLLPSFHEGIDIAPTRRDRRGRPGDLVYAMAGGRVAYANEVAGNSTYGVYVVVTHEDPMGTVYTLYSHLANVQARQGQSVDPGTPLGLMGNTATYNIPMARAHLHFEIGVILNERFDQWFRSRKLTPSHGAYHGWNLLGIDPLDFLEHRHRHPHITLGEVLDATPAAFQWLIRTERLPDYFRRYPSRWRGEPYRRGVIAVDFSENGVPLHGRMATETEAARIGSQAVLVSAADPETLGRNGRRLVVRQGASWTLGSAGEKHLEMMLY